MQPRAQVFNDTSRWIDSNEILYMDTGLDGTPGNEYQVVITKLGTRAFGIRTLILLQACVLGSHSLGANVLNHFSVIPELEQDQDQDQEPEPECCHRINQLSQLVRLSG